ncbi:MAG: autotransporter domain-containing protein [Neisseria sp.]|nr:autotransporter domain-containing protein [Neisseria sp.]
MKRKILAGLIAATAIEGVYADGFSDTVFFGDSLTDSGYFKPLLQQAGMGGGAFTTNPDATWAQWLADSYGHSAIPNGNGQNGSNYAVGGARVATAVTNNSLGVAVDVPSVAAQVNRYLTERGGRADADALYSVWGGANDLLAAAETPATAALTLGSAASQQAAAVKQLADAGARYILVSNLPDVGLTPMAAATGTQAQSTAAAQGYNTLLYGNLRASGVKVIPLDMFTLLQQVGADPQHYGFGNFSQTACTVTSSLLCTRDTLQESGAENSYFFADGIHPTGGAHKVIAQYAQSVLDAPAKMGQVGSTALAAGGLNRASVDRRLQQPAAEGIHWWAEAQGSDAPQNEGVNGNIRPGLTLGVERSGGVHRSGLYLHRADRKYDWQSGGGFKLKQTGFGAYHRYGQNSWWLNAQAGYDRIEAETDRAVALGAATHRHQAKAAGHLFGAAFKGGRQWQQGKLGYGPVAGLSYERLLLGALAENNRQSATAMRFEKQTPTSFKASVGMQADYALTPAWRVFGSAAYERELKKQRRDMTASLFTVPLDGFSLPAAENKRNSLSLDIGAAFDTGRISLNGGISHRRGNAEGTGMFVGVSSRF